MILYHYHTTSLRRRWKRSFFLRKVVFLYTFKCISRHSRNQIDMKRKMRNSKYEIRNKFKNTKSKWNFHDLRLSQRRDENNPQITQISTDKKRDYLKICVNRSTELTTKSAKSVDKKYLQVKKPENISPLMFFPTIMEVGNEVFQYNAGI